MPLLENWLCSNMNNSWRVFGSADWFRFFMSQYVGGSVRHSALQMTCVCSGDWTSRTTHFAETTPDCSSQREAAQLSTLSSQVLFWQPPATVMTRHIMNRSYFSCRTYSERLATGVEASRLSSRNMLKVKLFPNCKSKYPFCSTWCRFSSLFSSV